MLLGTRARFWLSFLAIWALLILRRPGSLATPAIWAEDGAEFLAAAAGAPRGLVYAGQLWFPQWILSWPIGHLPVGSWAVLAYLTATAVAAGSIAVILQQRAESVFCGYPWRLGIAVALALVPGMQEIQGNLSNIHFYLLLGAFVILALPPPDRRWPRAAELGFLAVSGLTAFVGVFALPMALWQAARLRTRYSALRATVIAAAACVNVVLAVLSPREFTQWPDPILTVEATIKRTAGTLVLGESGTREAWREAFWSPWLIPALLLIGLVATLIWRDRRGPSPIWLLSALGWILVGVTSLTPGPTRELIIQPFMHDRYWMPTIFVTILIIGRALATDRSWIAYAAAGLCCLGILADAHLSPVSPALNPPDVARFADCLDGPSRPCELAIAPSGWYIRVPG